MRPRLPRTLMSRHTWAAIKWASRIRVGQFMRKYRVELLTFSDGRGYQYEQLLPINRDYQRRVKEAIEGTGKQRSSKGERSSGTTQPLAWRPAGSSKLALMWSSSTTLFGAFPTSLRSQLRLIPLPILLFSNLNPSELCMVGMLVSAGTMDQLVSAEELLSNFPCNQIHGVYGDFKGNDRGWKNHED